MVILCSKFCGQNNDSPDELTDRYSSQYKNKSFTENYFTEGLRVIQKKKDELTWSMAGKDEVT